MKQVRHRRSYFMWSHLYEMSRINQCSREKKHMNGCQEMTGRKNRECLLMGTRFPYGVMKVFYSVVKITKICGYTKKYTTVYFKRVNFMEWELQLASKSVGSTCIYWTSHRWKVFEKNCFMYTLFSCDYFLNSITTIYKTFTLY